MFWKIEIKNVLFSGIIQKDYEFMCFFNLNEKYFVHFVIIWKCFFDLQAVDVVNQMLAKLSKKKKESNETKTEIKSADPTNALNELENMLDEIDTLKKETRLDIIHLPRNETKIERIANDIESLNTTTLPNLNENKNDRHDIINNLMSTNTSPKKKFQKTFNFIWGHIFKSQHL